MGQIASGWVWVLPWVGSVLNGVGWFRLGLGSAVGRFSSEWGGLVQAGLVGSDWVGVVQVGSSWVWVLPWVGSVLNGVGWFRLGWSSSGCFRLGLGSALAQFGSEWSGSVQF